MVLRLYNNYLKLYQQGLGLYNGSVYGGHHACTTSLTGFVKLNAASEFMRMHANEGCAEAIGVHGMSHATS